MQLRPLRPQSWWTICCREPFHGAATRSRDSLPMYHLSPTRVPSVRKQNCFISFAILFHIFPLVIYCLLHQWNHRVTGYEFCNRVEPKLEPKPITTSTREGLRNNLFKLGGHYSCWCPGDTMSQVINSQDTDYNKIGRFLSSLTHCALVTPYGISDLGQHWFR